MIFIHYSYIQGQTGQAEYRKNFVGALIEFPLLTTTQVIEKKNNGQHFNNILIYEQKNNKMYLKLLYYQNIITHGDVVTYHFNR